MTIGRVFEFPEEQRRQRRRAKQLAWLSIVLLTSAGVLLFLTLGQSEAMKTAWVSDVLSIIPPIALLTATRFELRPPSKRFPFGYLRAISVAFLVTASVLSVIGLYLLFDALTKLLKQDRPPIGTMVLFGHQFWAGWAMIAALAYSLLAGLIVGRLKQPVAKKLHDKELQAESRMNRDEWMSEGAAIVGILLVGFGRWWGDAVAAAFIAIEIVKDGWYNVRQVIGDLMDESPTVMGSHELEDIPAKVKDAAEQLEWVEQAAVRLREQGHVLTGDVLVVPRDGSEMTAADLAARTERAADDLSKVDWRLHGLVVMPVSHLEETAPPRL